MTPDAAFLKFFATDFQQMLERVEIPGLAQASWDRKAAYLLWCATKPPGGGLVLAPSEPPTPPEPTDQDIFG